MTPKDPFLEETFWDKFWQPIRSRALLFTPENVPPTHPKNLAFSEVGPREQLKSRDFVCVHALQTRAPSKRREEGYKILRWHVCRVNFARKNFFEPRIFVRKMLRKFPRNFRALFLWVRKKKKNPTKFPPNFPNFSAKKKKKFTDNKIRADFWEGDATKHFSLKNLGINMTGQWK